MRLRGRLLLSAGCAALAAGAFAAGDASPAPAAPLSVGPERALTGAHGQRYSPQASLSGDGRALLTWGEGMSGRIVARLGTTRGHWRPQQVLIGRGETRVQGIGSNGTAAVAWYSAIRGHVKQPSILLRIASPGGRFGPARVITSGRGISAPAGVVVRPDGSVVVAWTRPLSAPERDPSKLYFALVPAGGAAIERGLIGTSDGEAPRLAETPGGAVVLAYNSSFGVPNGPQNHQALASLLPAGASAFEPTQVLGPNSTYPYAEASDAPVSGPTGTSLLVNVNEGSRSRTELRAVSDSGALGAPVLLAATPRYSKLQSQEFSAMPNIVLAGDGAIVAAWQEIRYAGEYGGRVAAEAVMASIAAGNGSGTSVQQIAGFGAPALPSAPVLGAFADVTLAVWHQQLGGCRIRLYYAGRTDGGAFTAPRPLSAGFGQARQTCGSDEEVLTSAGTQALAVWTQGGRIVVRSFSA